MATNGGKSPGRPVQSTKQVLAAARLAAGDSVAEAATALNIGERTITRWLTDDGFRRLVRETRSLVFDQVIGRVIGLGRKATGKVGQLIDSANERIALDAAKAALSLGLEGRKAEDLEAVVREMEAKVAALTAGDQQPVAGLPADAEDDGPSGGAGPDAAPPTQPAPPAPGEGGGS